MPVMPPGYGYFLTGSGKIMVYCQEILEVAIEFRIVAFIILPKE